MTVLLPDVAEDICDSCRRGLPGNVLTPVVFPDATFLVCHGCLPK